MDECYCINCGATLRHLSSDKDWQRAHCRMCLTLNAHRNADRLAGPAQQHEVERRAALATLDRRLRRRLRELGA